MGPRPLPPHPSAAAAPKDLETWKPCAGSGPSLPESRDEKTSGAPRGKIYGSRTPVDGKIGGRPISPVDDTKNDRSTRNRHVYSSPKEPKRAPPTNRRHLWEGTWKIKVLYRAPVRCHVRGRKGTNLSHPPRKVRKRKGAVQRLSWPL